MLVPTDDVRNLKQAMTDHSDAVKRAVDQGKCWDQAMQGIKLLTYEKRGNYAQFLPGSTQRFCAFWGRGF
jgi:hypothetical protein